MSLKSNSIAPESSAIVPISDASKKISTATDLVELARQVQSCTGFVNASASSRLHLIVEQMQHLKKQAEHILSDMERDVDLHKLPCNVVKKPGNTYHIYERPNGSRYLGFLSPSEWGPSCPNKFIDSYKLLADMTWVNVHDLGEREQIDEIVQRLFSKPLPAIDLSGWHVTNCRHDGALCVSAVMTDYSKVLIEDALKESGWQYNFAFPVASDDNKYLINLLSEVKVKTRLLEEEAVDYKDKNSKLRTHLALVQHERAMTQAVLLERQRELDAMRHGVCLADREIGRTHQDLQTVHAERKEVNARIRNLENQIFTKSNELSSIKSQMDHDQNLIDLYLDACEEEIRVRDRLEAMKETDDTGFAALNREAGRLSDTYRDVRRKLDTVVSKNEALRVRVAAASESCRRENHSRRDVLHVWELCVNQMAKRDEDYTQLSGQYDNLLDEIRDQSRRVEETKKMFNLVQDDVKMAEKSIARSNREIWNTRCTLQELMTEVQLMEDELQTLQRQLERTEIDMRSVIATTKENLKTLSTMTENFDNMQDKVNSLEERLVQVTDKRLTSQQLAKMAEEKLASDEKCQKQAFDYHNQLITVSLKSSEKVILANKDRNTVETDFNGAINSLKGLKKRTNEYESELIKLDELIYKSQLFNQRLEQRIARMEADPLLSHEEHDLKAQKVRTLQAELDSRTKSCNTLNVMINNFMNDKRICKIRSQKVQIQLDQTQTKLDTAQLIMTNTKLAQRKHEALWREMLVECNLKRHQVRKMQARLNLLRNKVMSEETKQLQIDAFERNMDIELSTHKNNIVLDLRQMEMRIGDARGELTIRQRRLEQIKARYNVTVTTTTASNDDALGARMRYLLEALQARQDMRHKGDNLDAEVRRAEEELRALENTVVVMNSLNEAARGQALMKSQEQPLVAEREAIDAKLAEEQGKLTTQREQRRALRGSIMHYQMQMEELEQIYTRVTDRYRDSEELLEKAQKTIEGSVQRYERSMRMLNQVVEKLNRFYRANQADIDVRLQRDFNRLIYSLYERCLKNAPVDFDELVLAERQISDDFNFRKPSMFNSRRPAASKRITTTTASNDDALGARMRYLLEALQARQDMRHKGDNLDAEVRRAEEELRALENTVVVMNSLNEAARGQALMKSQEQPLVAEREAIDAKLAEEQGKLTTQREQRRALRGSIMHYQMQMEELEQIYTRVTDRYRDSEELLEKAQKTIEGSVQRYERSMRMLNQVVEKLNRFYRANQADIDVRLQRDFNRLIYSLYERCLKNAPVDFDELVLAERQISDDFNFRKPSMFNSRRPAASKRRMTSSRTSTLSRLDSQAMSVISIGEQANLPSMSEVSAPNGLQRMSRQNTASDVHTPPEHEN